VNLGAIVNSYARESGVKISSDSLLLFFSGDTMFPYQPGGFGMADIWMTSSFKKRILQPQGDFFTIAIQEG